MPNQTLMAPTNPKTRHKPEKTKVGEEVLDLVIPYIHSVEDRNSVSLVSRNFYEIDGITRKRLTVHVHYYPNPTSLSTRFPFIESLTLKGPPFHFTRAYPNGSRITPSPWIEQLALAFRCLKELCIHRFVIHDEDLETLARTRGKDIRSLKIKMCKGFSTDGLMHVSKYCNKLRTFSLENYYNVEVKDLIWLHQLALNSTVLERFHVTDTDIFDAEDLKLLAKNCSNSLISLKIGKCYLSKLRDAFRYAFKLEHFSGYSCDEESDLIGFHFPPNIRSLSRMNLHVTQYLGILPLLNQIRKLKLKPTYVGMRVECQCLLFKRCPNLEVLYTLDECGDKGLQVISRFCKKLRKLTYDELVTHVGLIPLAKGCTKLECLKIRPKGITNEATKCLGTHLKNLRKFRMKLVRKDGTIDLPLDNGILAMLMGCQKLERLKIVNNVRLRGLLTDVGLGYVGSYGANLRSLSLTRIGTSNAGLVKLSKGCPRLRKLKFRGCPFSKEAVASCVFNLPSLRYVSGYSKDFTALALSRPEF